MVKVKEDKHYLVEVFNLAEKSIFIWPRISTNFIAESYVRNCVAGGFGEQYSKLFMHRIPAGKFLKFNYDFFGTNHFPIENLSEQLFFMLAINETNNEKEPILSQSLSRAFEKEFEFKFDNNETLYFMDAGSFGLVERRVVVNKKENVLNLNLRKLVTLSKICFFTF